MAVCLQLPAANCQDRALLKSAALPDFGSRISAAAARTEMLRITQSNNIGICGSVSSRTWFFLVGFSINILITRLSSWFVIHGSVLNLIV